MTTNVQSSCKRESWVDWAKTFLIFFIVLGHSSIEHNSMTWTLIYSFHVPAFFMVSGYLFKPHDWKRTLKSLGVPIIFFSLFNFIYYICVMYIKFGHVDWLYWMVSVWKPFYTCSYDGGVCLFPGIWFIEVLFVCRLLMGDIKQITFLIKYPVPIIVFCIVFMQFYESLNIPEFITDICIFRVFPCLSFMLLGYIIRQKNIIAKLLGKKIYFYISLFFSLAVYLTITQNIGFISIWSNNYGDNFCLFFINAFVSSLALFLICTQFHSNSFIEIISKGTLFILGTHFVLLRIFNFLLKIMHYESDFSIWIIGITIILFCYYPIQLCIKYCPIIIGK